MQLRPSHTRGLWPRRAFARSALSLGLLTLPLAAGAASAIIYGSISNFDIANDTGKICHGFEIEIDGVTPPQVPYSFSANRYGTPAVTATPTGTKVRWESPYNAATNTWMERTLPHTVPWFSGQCYQWVPATYQDGGCEHFGTGATANMTRVVSRWLCENPAQPGTLVAEDPPTAVPYANYYVEPPIRPNDPPVLVAEVDAPEPAEAPELYGDAQWMRVYKQELPRQLTLEELVADNPAAVPMNLAQLESDWQIVQAEPVSGGNGNRGRHRNQGNIAPTTQAVVRRIELYQFTGQYDQATHEALCADLLCNAPAADERGELISVQMTAANVQPDSLVVVKTGNGNVDGADKLIACGNKCAQPYDAGTFVTLNAKPGSGSSFLGWGGACAGTQLSCAVTVNGIVNVRASFSAPSGGGGGGGGGGTTSSSFTLSVGKSNSGTVTATPTGLDRALDCGKVCSAKFESGKVVTLTATPPVGKTFVNWGGACSGTALTCKVTMTANLSAQANFSK